MAAQQPQLKRVYGVTNIKSHVPFLLDVDDGNYNAWRELFLAHCQSFDVAGHFHGKFLPINDDDEAWKKRDGLVKLLLCGTLSKDLFKSIFKIKGTSRDLAQT